MSWKERIKPSNNAESGCYKFVGLVIAVVLWGILFPYLGEIGNIIVVSLIAFGFVVSMTWSFFPEIKGNYDAPNSDVFKVTLISIVGTILLCFIMLAGFMLFLSTLQSFISASLYDFLDGLLYIIFLFSLMYLALKINFRLSQFLAENVWHLKPLDNSKT